MLGSNGFCYGPLYQEKHQKANFFKKAVLRLGSPICCPAVTYNRELCGGPVFNPGIQNDLDWGRLAHLCRKAGLVYL